MQGSVDERLRRADMIKQARESFNHHADHSASQRKFNVAVNENMETEVTYKWKSFMVRTIIGAILFLFVLCVDQMSISYNDLKSSSIKEIIETNQTVETIQESTANFAKEKIIPVFHRLW
jgi:hypothetical protein